MHLFIIVNWWLSMVIPTIALNITALINFINTLNNGVIIYHKIVPISLIFGKYQLISYH